jgi:hypothetical protein
MRREEAPMNHAAPRSVALAVLTYRARLRLYPRSFQRRFADEMIQVFRVTCHDSWRRGGGWELFALTLTTAFDVTITATREHVTRGRRAWGEVMAPGAWDRPGGFMAAGAIVLGALVMTFGPLRAPAGQPVSLTADDVINGVRFLSVAIVLIVIGAMVRTQRTWIGRFSGRVALIGVGLHFFFVDLWLATPLLNAHPQVRSILAAWGGSLVALSLLGGIGLIISTVRYREMEDWRGGALLWRRWEWCWPPDGALPPCAHEPRHISARRRGLHCPSGVGLSGGNHSRAIAILVARPCVAPAHQLRRERQGNLTETSER